MGWFRKKPIAYRCTPSPSVRSPNFYMSHSYRCHICKERVLENKVYHLVVPNIPIDLYAKILLNVPDIIDQIRMAKLIEKTIGLGCTEEHKGVFVTTCRKCFAQNFKRRFTIKGSWFDPYHAMFK